MKKNTLLSIALCAGLMLPNAGFASQPQSWYQYLSSYMPQWDLGKWATNLVGSLSDRQKYALYAALTAALGYGYWKYAGTQQKTTQEILSFEYKDPVKIEDPSDYGSWTYRTPEEKRAIELNNVAIFLHSVEPDYENNKAMWPTEIDSTVTADHPFVKHVLPTLKNLMDQYSTNYAPHGRGERLNKAVWIDFIHKVKTVNPQIRLTQDDEEYLKMLQPYTKDLFDPSFNKSITRALAGLEPEKNPITTIKRKPNKGHPWK